MSGLKTRASLALAAAIAVVATGCTAEEPPADPAEWVAAQEHVTDAELVPYADADDEDDVYLSVTLEKGLDDDTVQAVVDGIQEHFDDLPGAPSLRVDVDGFRASVFPGLSGLPDSELLRALWLRADGRALSYGDAYESRASTHPLVIAPAAEVAQLALDYDAAVTHENDGRYSISVEAEDGSTGVQWAVSEELGFGIGEAVQAFADLQRQYPRTTGWVDAYGSETKGSVRFSPEDVSLDAVSAGLIDPALFTSLEIGWGPAVEDAATFAETYSDPLARDVLTAVMAVDGVTRLGVYDAGVGMQATVTAETVAAVQQALALAPGLDASVAVRFSRGPALFRKPETPVFTVDAHTPPAHRDAYLALAGVPAIREVVLTADRGTIVVDHEATDEELAAAFASLLALPPEYASTEVHVVLPGIYRNDDRYVVGTADREGFRLEADPAAPDDVQEPAKRIAKAWEAALG